MRYEDTTYDWAHDGCDECIECVKSAEKAFKPSAVFEATTYAGEGGHWGTVRLAGALR